MDDNAPVEPPISGRGSQFGMGMISAQNASPSLSAYAARYNAQVPRSYHPSGSLNGISLEQYKATLGGAFATNNGSASDTWDIKRYFQGNNA